MLEFSVFDFILDSVIVVDETGKIAYCNEMAATFCQTSVRRVVGKAMFSDIMAFAEPGLLPFTPQSPGFASPSSLIETAFNLVKVEKVGKVQLTVRPVDEKHWIFFIHDVSLEETLAAKYRQELKKTEEYARNLEILVEARTAELRVVNQTLNAILDSLGQGFFTFNSEGVCGSVFTKACEVVLEGTPKDRKAWEVLGVPAKEEGQFRQWMDSSFKELLPFDDLKNLGPSLFPHSQHKHVALEFYPIRREKNVINEIVVVATDKTAEHEAQVALEAERQYAAMIVKYVKNKEQFLQFLVSVRTSMDTLTKMAEKVLDSAAISESFRVLHTLEGEAGTFSLRELRLLSRESQHILEPFKSAGAVPAVEHKTYVDSLVSMRAQFEKFLTENENVFQISDGEDVRAVEVAFHDVEKFGKQLSQFPNAAALITKYNDIFLKVPIDSRLKYFDGLVQGVAERLGKKVKPLIIEGGDIRIFPDPYQKFFSSLVHAFRNAVDHGLEDPTEREWGGKDPAGQLRVKVIQDAKGIHLTISDDGKGIDPAVIREKLKTKFPDRDFTSQSDEEIIQNVALPGFSSRESVGEFSGRGIGLDALREEVQNIGGTLHLKSKVNEGTTIEISIPNLGLESDLLRSA